MNGGLLTAADLAAYRPAWQDPVHVTYRGYDVFSNPATSRGGIELAMQLNLAEGFDLDKMGRNSPEALHVLIEAIKVAKADVYRYVADPKFTQIPIAPLLSKQYADERRKLIVPQKAMAYPSWAIRAPREPSMPVSTRWSTARWQVRLSRTLYAGVRHDQLFDHRSVRQCGRLHPDARWWLWRRRRRRQYGVTAEQRRAARVHFAVP